MRRRLVGCWLLGLMVAGPASGEGPLPLVGFQHEQAAVILTVNRQPVASYVFADQEIPRPYFAHVRAPGGLQVTRNHPPVQDQDRTDHARMHPGIWLAFGDLSGTDFWRNKGAIVHDGFVVQPAGDVGRGSFVHGKKYLRSDGSLVCREQFAFAVYVRPGGYLWTWDSTFFAEDEFHFGDQEEMGLGVRVATHISELFGGRLSDSQGRLGAQQIWSQPARWVDYSGTIDGQHVGITLLCHPGNFRDSWMHARDYGLVAANLFGRQAMQKGASSQISVPPGERFRLRYGIWIHAGESDFDATYAGYLQLAGGEHE